MGGARALITVRAGISYINDETIAQRYIELLAQHATLPQASDEVSDDLVLDFKKRMKAVGSEVASQMAVTVATNIACPSGGKAYRAARKVAPQQAEDIRRSTRSSGHAKHELSGLVANSTTNVLTKTDANDNQKAVSGIAVPTCSLVGEWESCEGKPIKVIDTTIGPLVQFDESSDTLTKIKMNGDEIRLNQWAVILQKPDEILWKLDGEIKRKDELREVTWRRRPRVDTVHSA
eukprot:TRINITY_DN19254_c0_g1_i1.p1 TRINITY_DN19254_c0_g1~~TRINITY_DN19254_c0_g1_i1.p1  ORF type:complete len:234 (+),score=38.67 TRINITY_DN19254_c0_g1_i1:93-794(+)